MLPAGRSGAAAMAARCQHGHCVAESVRVGRRERGLEAPLLGAREDIVLAAAAVAVHRAMAAPLQRRD
eukprot:899514-Lingulodinium_polyedra.AAC.1